MTTKRVASHSDQLHDATIEEIETYDDIHRAPPCSPASFDVGVWFQSAASGLWYEWYEVKNAAGSISAVKIDGVIYRRSHDENTKD